MGVPNLAAHKPEKQLLQCRQMLHKIKARQCPGSTMCLNLWVWQHFNQSAQRKETNSPWDCRKRPNSHLGRTLGRFCETLGFDVVFQNPKALEPFLQEERVGANPCGAIPSYQRIDDTQIFFRVLGKTNCWAGCKEPNLMGSSHPWSSPCARCFLCMSRPWTPLWT
jgi:hypothetical protein